VPDHYTDPVFLQQRFCFGLGKVLAWNTQTGITYTSLRKHHATLPYIGYFTALIVRTETGSCSAFFNRDFEWNAASVV